MRDGDMLTVEGKRGRIGIVGKKEGRLGGEEGRDRLGKLSSVEKLRDAGRPEESKGFGDSHEDGDFECSKLNSRS